LKKNNINFAYEPHSFYLDGKYYTPDFYIPDKELYIELKGFWRNVSKTKIKKVSEFVSIILLPSYFQSKLRKYKRKDDVVK
jgi:predicted nuclease of restriction endonuclease-like RecB superfamily